MFKIIPQDSNPSKEPEVSFPKIMIHKEEPKWICFFFETQKCLVLSSPDMGIHEIGTIQDYDSKYFKDYNLPITIQNHLPITIQNQIKE